MIVDIQTAMDYIGGTAPGERVIGKLKAIEGIIRDYTHNNFQERRIRFYAPAVDDILKANSSYLEGGDSIEISESINSGVYTVTNIESGGIKVDKKLYDVPHNMVTKIVYPEAVKNGALNLLKWDIENRDKVGIKSETISRHQVTYFDMDSNSESGYPSSLMGFLDPYIQPRY